MRIDGVSEETNADGEVTSTFEYFRQPEEELESGIGTTDIRPDATELPKDMVRSPPFCSMQSTCVAPDVVHAPLRVADGPRQALAAPLGADQGNGQRPLLNYDLCDSYGGNKEGNMGSRDEFRFCYHPNLYSQSCDWPLQICPLSYLPLLISAPTKLQGWS